jgi:membrane protein DedA with SNARE-associated domain
MKRRLKRRLLLTLAATVVGAACGTLAGYLVGRIVTLHQVEFRLEQSGARTMTEADASSREARAVLAAMNASPYPY